jgi:hypothetical protein
MFTLHTMMNHQLMMVPCQNWCNAGSFIIAVIINGKRRQSATFTIVGLPARGTLQRLLKLVARLAVKGSGFERISEQMTYRQLRLALAIAFAPCALVIVSALVLSQQ